ncbi:MAG: DUF3043 domain-containing protein [Candidatus Nanopelagicales bacterium]|nr:DUF3043 domain-containing protein [Candidatus Nanopelagicales bacterium]
MFFNRSDDKDPSSTALSDDRPSVEKSAGSAPKGRPTPTRKEAEAARKSGIKGGAKPGASPKEARKAEREQVRIQRMKNREALMRGDEKALPARDQGPVKRFVRTYVDSRRTVAEFFVPLAIVVLLLGLSRNQRLQVFVTLVWMLALVIVIVDTAINLVRMNNALRKEFPDKAERKGVNFYAVMRMLQIRRLRVPPPQFKAGGRPVTPKAPKAPKK